MSLVAAFDPFGFGFKSCSAFACAFDFFISDEISQIEFELSALPSASCGHGQATEVVHT